VTVVTSERRVVAGSQTVSATTLSRGGANNYSRPMQRIEIDQDFTLPVERVYAYLAEHEHLEALFGAKIARVRDGDTSRNGVGSVRQLRIGILPPFEETVTTAVENELIEYKITKGSPLRDHTGTMTFSSTSTGSHLSYVIEFAAVLPGLDKLIAIGLERAVRKGLTTVDANA
jgi:uncharacterized protein YndB with AHSA1/START domain